MNLKLFTMFDRKINFVQIIWVYFLFNFIIHIFVVPLSLKLENGHLYPHMQIIFEIIWQNP